MGGMLAKTHKRVKDEAASLTEREVDATVREMVSRSARALFYGVAAALLTGCASGRGAPPPKEQATPPAPEPPKVTLTDVKNTQDAQAQEIARLGAELKAQDAQQSFLVAELKTLSEQVAKLKASLEEAESAVRSMRATPVAPESRPAAPPAPPPGSAPAIVTPPPAAAPPPPPPPPRATSPRRARTFRRAHASRPTRATVDGHADCCSRPAQSRGGAHVRGRPRAIPRGRRRTGRPRVHGIRLAVSDAPAGGGRAELYR